MSELNPEFKSHLEEALRRVSADEIEEVTAEQKLAELGLDSICVSEIVLELEEQMDITIDEDKVAELETFGDLEKLALQLKKEKS